MPWRDSGAGGCGAQVQRACGRSPCMRWIALVLALVVFPASALAADVKEIPVQVPATQPTDSGAPVKLDGGIDVPTSGCPCPGVIINHGFTGKWTDSGSVAREL